MQDPEKTADTGNGLGLDLSKELAADATSPVDASPPATSDAPSVAPSSAAAAAPGPVKAVVDEATQKAVDQVLYSDIGVNTLLNRLKQSIASVRDFSSFLKERSNVEDEHAKKLRRMCKTTFQNIRSGDSRQGSYAQQFEAVTNLHERMADNGLQFSLNLHQMHEDLNQLAYEMEKGRKHWKTTGLNAEQRVQDAERQLDKAKQKYDSLAEDYDHAKTGDKASGRHFGLRGPKSGAQYEEDLLKKLQIADKDYQSKVQVAQQERQQLISSARPQAIKSMLELISECDAGLSLQFQKFAVFSEKLLLGNGILMSPLNEPDSPQQRSMRDMIAQIDNQQDFHGYVRSFSGKVPTRAAEIEYKKHPTLMSSQVPGLARQQEPQLPPKDQSPPRQTQPQGLPAQAPPQFPMAQYSPDLPKPSQGAPVIPPQNFEDPYSPGFQQQQQSPRGPGGIQGGPVSPTGRGYGGPPPQQYPRGPHQPPPGPYGNGRGHYPPNGPGGPGGPSMGMPPGPMGSGPIGPVQHQRPSSRDRNGQYRGPPRPVKPLFGLTLDELFQRDLSPVPLVVSQCIQAVELYGLEYEGIYRVSGNTAQVQELKSLFNNDASRIDFRNLETFHHDVNNPANLLKLFLRELPDPLLTVQHYKDLIEAAKIQDDLVRRDSLHALINALPDPNYATLRAVVLHLHRVVQHSEANRMTPMNLAVVFAPTLMGSHNGPMTDASLQPKVVETILVNALEIFDDD